MKIHVVDWNDPRSKLTPQGNFTVHEALWLPRWMAYHRPTAQEKENILRMAAKMEKLREIVGAPINVNSWIRPAVFCCEGHRYHGENYNLFIGSTASKSGHLFGLAVDWFADGYVGAKGCAELREKIKPHLKRLDIRMENIKGNWIHNDDMPVKYRRFFKP